MNITNIKPTLDRLLVERQKVTEMLTEGGIILTPGLTMSANYSPTAKVPMLEEKDQEEEENAYTALVLEAGPDVKGVKKGDKVLMSKYSGLDLFKDRVTFLIKENDVLAIVI